MISTRAVFLAGTLLIKKKKLKSSTLFVRTKSVLPSQLTLLTENLLANCHFYENEILQIISNPESKTHGHDMISIHMLKLCVNSICQSLEIIFKT